MPNWGSTIEKQLTFLCAFFAFGADSDRSMGSFKFNTPFDFFARSLQSEPILTVRWGRSSSTRPLISLHVLCSRSRF